MGPGSQARRPPPAAHPARDPLLDILRGLTILWVILFHFHADARGVASPAAAGPSALVEAVQGLDGPAAAGAVATALAGRPSVRLDIFLFVTAWVLTRARYRGAGAFLARRARAVLPAYWLGTVLVALALAGLAAFRAAWLGHAFAPELASGSLLAGQPYRFEPADLARSLSVAGRFAGGRAMQIVAPSSWYIALALQLYAVFPLLRAAQRRLGTVPFVALVVGVSTLARAWLLGLPHGTVLGFAPASAAVELLPFRLAPVALGMAAAGLVSLRDARGLFTRPLAAAAVVPAVLLLLCSGWLSSNANAPLTLAGILGPLVPFAVGLPGAALLAASAGAWPAASRTLEWAGRRSLALLIVQDVLRFAVGTAVVCGAPVAAFLWPLAPFYLAAALAMAGPWQTVTDRVGERMWPAPAAPATPRGPAPALGPPPDAPRVSTG